MICPANLSLFTKVIYSRSITFKLYTDFALSTTNYKKTPPVEASLSTGGLICFSWLFLFFQIYLVEGKGNCIYLAFCGYEQVVCPVDDIVS